MPKARPRPSLLLALALVPMSLPLLAGAMPRPYAATVDLEAANVFLQAPRSILVSSSPAGAHLYVTGGSGVIGLDRDGATGTVRFIERREVDPANGSAGEGAISPDGRHLYVPTTAASVFGGFHLSILSRDPATGVLEAAGGVQVPGGTNAVAVSGDGAHVYATGAAVAAFARDALTGALTAIGQVAVANAAGVDVSPDGAHVYVTRPADSAVSIFARNLGSGALTPVGTVADGTGGVEGLSGVTDLAFSPDGAQVYAAGEGENAVAVFSRNPVTGGLAFLESHHDGIGGLVGLVRPSGLAVSADGGHLYVAAGPSAAPSAPGAVVAFARDLVAGTLAFASVLENGGSVEGLGGPAIAISPDDRQVYAAGGTALAVLARDAGTGATSFVQRRSGFGGFALQGARDLVPSADGGHVYVGSEVDRAVGIFGVSPVDGALAFAGAVYQGEQPGLSAVRVVASSPDGRHVYAASSDTGTIAAYERDPATGALTYVDEVVEGMGGVSGLTDPTAMLVSPDGEHAYVAGSVTASVAVFARDAVTGALGFVDVLVQGEGGVTGLSAPRALAISPDGTSLYAVGGSGEIAMLARDAGTGALTLVGVATDGDSGLDRLAGARDVAVTSDGTQVLVAAETDDAVVVFSRDSATGVLTAAAVVREVAGVGRLTAPSAVLVHADGGTVLAVAKAQLRGLGSVPAVWTFDRAPDGSLAFVNVAALSEVVRVARFGAGDEAYAAQIGFGVRLYRLRPGFVGCDPLPRSGCKGLGERGRSKLAVKVRTAERPVLKWKWANGASTLAGDFVRIPDDGVAWCLYDESGPTPALLARALAPGDAARWRATVPTKMKYKDRLRSPEGIQGILLSTSPTTARAKLKVTAGGPTLAVPLPALPLPLRVQLQGTTACWEGAFDAEGVLQNGAGNFIGSAQ
jgi:6-phosphogluconolactonase (cycloisomerase 2 family)